jgi:hypothetical protein
MAGYAATPVRSIPDRRGSHLRGPVAKPHGLPAPVGKPAPGPAAPVAAEVLSRRSEGLRLTDRGVAVIAFLLLAQFVAAVCLVVVGFVSVSNEPVSAPAGNSVAAFVSGR